MSEVSRSQSNTWEGTVSGIAAVALRWSPTAWIKSWLLYIGTQTHISHTLSPADLAPLTSICEHLHAVHIYTASARNGITRSVPAHHYCAHVSPTFRQCLIYDSNSPGARLIGIEYMIPAARYEKLPPAEKKYWHSHVHEVASGMLILPYPESHSTPKARKEWDRLETQALADVVGWYGKTWHFWEVDLEDEGKEGDGGFPWGEPKLMGSLTDSRQVDVDELMKGRDEEMGVTTREKRQGREGEIGQVLRKAEVDEGADEWWKEAEREGRGVYARD